MTSFYLENDLIGPNEPVYFIADIGASHDGDLDRAKLLIKLAHESGANAVKFQHFSAENFVSDEGFSSLSSSSHQNKWKKSVYEVYKDASIPLEWTRELKSYSEEIGITFFSSPYGIEMIDHLDQYVSVWKVGSGDINYRKQLHKLGQTRKPIMLATGASTMEEIEKAVNVCKQYTDRIVLMQCNTNYTGKDENFDHINLNVLKTFTKKFPDVILGLSDHTFGHETVLGAIALGARVVEKHFTDDNNREGPDHPFSMNPETWKKMVDSSRILQRSLGTTEKSVCDNELETVVLQRRSYVCNRDMNPGEVIVESDFSLKRPCPANSVDINKNIEGTVLKKKISKGSTLSHDHI